jgi:hypothetical protein
MAIWQALDKKERKQAIDWWKEHGPGIEAARDARGHHHLHPEKIEEFNKLLNRITLETGVPPAPAMPVVSLNPAEGTNASAKGQHKGKRTKLVDFVPSSSDLVDTSWVPHPSSEEHREKVGTRGFSDDWFALVHHPVPIDKAMTIPDAIKAIDKEWTKLDNKPFIIVEDVHERATLEQWAIDTKTLIHIGSLMILCHIKNYQLPKDQWSYKGRIVFR